MHPRCPQEILLVAVVLCLTGHALAEDQGVPGSSDRTSRRIKEIDDKLTAVRTQPSEKAWALILEELHALLGPAGDDLVSTGGGRYVQARLEVQRRLTALPPDVLRLHREKLEARAARSLERAARERDPVLLRRIVDDAFATRSAEKALDLLGDLAFDQGAFLAAESYWSQLATCLDPQGDLARIRAKQLLARWLGGAYAQPTSWQQTLRQFRQAHPEAVGDLGGERGKYSERLEMLTRTSAIPPHWQEAGWPTFAGSPTRQRALVGDSLTPERVASLCRFGPAWTVRLGPDLARAAQERVPTPGEAALSLAFHPVIVGRQILYADARFVHAVDWQTGERQRLVDATELSGGFNPDLQLPAPEGLRYTLTATDDVILARLGVQSLVSDRPARDVPRLGSSFLVCLNRQPEGNGKRLRWVVGPDGLPSTGIFEGTAVADAEHAYIAVTRFEGGQEITAIHCYRLDARETPPLLWKQDVCSSRGLQSGEARFRHHLLTLAGPQVIYCSHAGVVTSLETRTGKRVWAVRYPRVRVLEEDRPTVPRNAGPALFAHGKLFVAPADSDLLLCLDPLNGKTLWSQERIVVVQLLGVGEERLLFATATPRPGLRALKIDGAASGGWYQAAESSGEPVHTFGQALLAGGLVYWPTFHHTYVLSQATGEPTADPTLLHRLPPGNLAFGEGTLVVADRDQLYVFPPARERLKLPQGALLIEPPSLRDVSRLCVAQADAGQLEQADHTLQLAEKLAQKSADPESRSLLGQLRQEFHYHLLRAADMARAKEASAEVVRHLTRASRSEFPPPLRLHALARLAEHHRASGQVEAVSVLARQVLADPVLRNGHVLVQGLPQSASLWAKQPLTPGAAPAGPSVNSPAASLTLPLWRAWQRELPVGGRFFLPGTLCSCVPDQQGRHWLQAHDDTTGAIRWRQPIAAPTQWMGRHGDVLLACSSQILLAFDLGTGTPRWEYPAPPLGRALAPLAGFQLAGGRLFCSQQSRRLLALDAATGQLLWMRWAPGGFFHPPHRATTLGPFHPTADVIHLPQAESCLDAATGQCLQPLDPASPYLLSRRDPRTGVERWSYTVHWPTTLTGEPHLVRDVPGKPEACVLVVRHGHGVSVQRLEAGQPRWADPTLLRTGALSEEGLAVDSSSVYLALGRRLFALSLDQGRLRWSMTLPGKDGRAWQLHRSGAYLLAYPEPRRSQTFPIPGTFGQLEWGGVYARGSEGHYPLLLVAPESGRLVQRLNLPDQEPQLRIQRRGSIEAMTPQGIVSVLPSGLLVARGRQAWRWVAGEQTPPTGN